MARNKVLICVDAQFADAEDLAGFLDQKNVRLDKIVSGNLSSGAVTARVDMLFTQADLDAFFEAKGVTLFRARPYPYSNKTFRANKSGSTLKAAPIVTPYAVSKN